jgi:DNA-binding response OmpR family regulator
MGRVTDTPELKGLSILVVDADEDRRSVYVELLSCLDADCRAVATMWEALDAFDESPPKVLIADVNLPDEEGYALIAELRGRGDCVPAVAVAVGLADGMRAIELGYQAYVCKPVNWRLLAQVAEMLGKGTAFA